MGLMPRIPGIDFTGSKNGLQKSITRSATPPENPTDGQLYINSGDNTIYVFQETWRSTGITVPSTEGLYMGFGAFTYNY